MPSVRHQLIHEVVRKIPSGRVSTYGAVARRAGGCTPRLVGFALAALPTGSGVPWHRVINREGRISLPGETGLRQRTLLEAEGIEFGDSGAVDLVRFGWSSA
jgi:methylated-DNA-protein-cysteine methyltransferase related protein